MNGIMNVESRRFYGISHERMFFLSFVSSFIYTLMVGGVFVILFIFIYDFLYGEKKEKQIRKIHKHFAKEKVKKVEFLEYQPKNFTLYQIKTEKETKRVKLKPGYKIVTLVQKN
jgi:hypothetical protein